MSSADLDEKLDMISNDLLFHPHPVIESLWMDHESACEILGVKTRTLRWYAQRGLIRREYIDGRPVYPLTGVDVLKVVKKIVTYYHYGFPHDFHHVLPSHYGVFSFAMSSVGSNSIFAKANHFLPRSFKP